MARVALMKLFTGLNLGVSQLAGELQRAGHESRIIYFKDFLAVPVEDADRYIVSDYPGVLVGARGREMVWNVYKPFSEPEYRLLIDALREFRVDLIGLSLSSLTIKPAVEVTARLKEALGVPVVWGGSGPTLEPDMCIKDTDLVCVGEGEQVIVDLAQRIDAGEPLTNVPGVWAKDAAARDHPQPRPAAPRARGPRHSRLRSGAHRAHQRRPGASQRLPAEPRQPVHHHDHARVPVLVLVLHRERVPGHVRQEEPPAPPLGRRRHPGAGRGAPAAQLQVGDVLRRRLHHPSTVAEGVRAAATRPRSASPSGATRIPPPPRRKRSRCCATPAASP